MNRKLLLLMIGVGVWTILVVAGTYFCLLFGSFILRPDPDWFFDNKERYTKFAKQVINKQSFCRFPKAFTPNDETPLCSSRLTVDDRNLIHTLAIEKFRTKGNVVMIDPFYEPYKIKGTYFIYKPNHLYKLGYGDNILGGRVIQVIDEDRVLIMPYYGP